MNHKHSNSGKSHGHQSQTSMRGERSQVNSQYGRNFGSGKDTEYDYGGEMGDYEMNERSRPSRFSPDEDRTITNKSSFDSSLGRYAGSQGDSSLNRQGTSSEKFGYPSNMNAWSGNDRQYNSGRTSGRTGQSDWAQDSDLDLSGSMDTQRGHFGKGPKGYRRSDDRIKEEVCETLARHPRIDASEIEVEVSDSMVTLSGTVESKDIRRAAEMAIENLSGVDDVKNDIRVKKADSHLTSSDSTFAAPSSAKNAKMPTSSFKESSQNS